MQYFIITRHKYNPETYMVVIKKEDGSDSEVYYDLNKEQVYQLVSVHMDAFMYGGGL